MTAGDLLRIFVIVMDSLGIGAMPDSEKFGDIGVDTFGHILDKMGTLDIPNLQKLGMLNLHKGGNMEGVEKPLGRYMRIGETSNGKDTMTGHWEMMGIYTEKPFITFTETGFPKELIDELEKRCGKRVIGNKSASGTEIIEELGEEEINTGAMIVYTSADSVLQICGNEETFDLANLYRCCEIARELTMKDEWRVGRVIARPYVGKKKGEFKRTSNRHDYALKPTGRTALNALKDAGLIKNAGDGNSILTTSLILAMMILPTIIGTTESAMRAVPAHYYEGALALGATKERSIFRVIIPAAKSGVIAGIVLGIGRAVGETMAVIMVAGNQPRLVGNLFKGIRTLTGNIVMEMGYATGLHREALIATGVVLFVFILIINFSVALLKRRTDHE